MRRNCGAFSPSSVYGMNHPECDMQRKRYSESPPGVGVILIEPSICVVRQGTSIGKESKEIGKTSARRKHN
jgi:hypothetical protein